MVTMSAVWDRTSAFVSDHLAAIATVAALTMVVPGTLQGALQPWQAGAGPGLRGGIGLVGLLLSLVSLWGQLVLIALAIGPGYATGDATRLALARLPAVIGILLVLGVLLLAVMAPPFLVLIAAGYHPAMFAQSRPDLPPTVAVSLVIYILVLVPLLVWLSARLLPLSSVIVAERRALGALGRAFRLTRGLAMRIIGMMILFGIVALVAILAAQTVFGSVFRLVLGDTGSVDAAGILTAFVVALVQAGVTSLWAVFTAKFYLAVRDRDTAAIAA